MDQIVFILCCLFGNYPWLIGTFNFPNPLKLVRTGKVMVKKYHADLLDHSLRSNYGIYLNKHHS
jgi:hypothetical protein